jgi:putative membrane protein
MTSRLWYGITWPSAILTLILGVWLLIEQPAYLKEGFMHIKLTLVFVLYLYHWSHQYIFNLLKKDVVKYSSGQLRLWNEVATLLLIAIVFLIVLRDSLGMIWAIAGLIGLAISILLGIRIYKRLRRE